MVADISAHVLEPVQTIVMADIAAISVYSADSIVDVPVVDVQHVTDDVAAEDDSKPRTVSPEVGEDDTAPFTCATYILFPTIDAAKRRLLFLFLPRKEKIKGGVAIFESVWWSMLCLKESDWGPPVGVEIWRTYKRVIFILVCRFIFYI